MGIFSWTFAAHCPNSRVFKSSLDFVLEFQTLFFDF